MCRVFGLLLSLAFLAIATHSADAAGESRIVSVRTLTLTHTGTLSADDQNFVIREIKNHKYASTDLAEIGDRIRYAMQVRGYFKVLADDPVLRVVSQDRHSEIVDIRVAVQAGQRYRLGTISFNKPSVFPPAELRGQFPIADGDILNREKIGNGLENLRVLYGNKGYVNFSAVPATTIDEATRTVSLLIDLDAGNAFHLGKLTVLGEESVPGARDKLLDTWKHYAGRIYDPILLTSFLRDLDARRSVRPEEVFEICQDTQARTINVQIRLVKPYTMSFPNK